jgi:hypothetical protein
MGPSSDVNARNGRSILRWLSALPAALLAEIVVRFLLGAVSPAGNVQIVLLDALPAFAFVLAGAYVAPRRLTAAIVLTLCMIARSLTQHILIQQFAGGYVGVTNYTHFLAESAGALCGVIYIALQIGKNRRRDVTA